MSGQLGFDLGELPRTDTTAPASTPPARGRGKGRPQRPDLTVEVLTAVRYGQLGMLDDTDRVVVFEEHDRVRLSADEDAVLSLLREHYVERRPPRDTASCLHGVARKPVTPLRLTRSGETLLRRLSAYKSLPA